MPARKKEPKANPKAASDIDRLIGGKIRRFRVEAGISQTDLGTASGITFQQVQKYENGKNRVTVARLAQIAQTLGVPLTSFFADFPGDVLNQGRAKAELSAADQIAQSEKGLRLVKAFLAIDSSSTRTRVVDLVRAIAHGESNGLDA
jgi:transcriptional regulator with XRE-family HTH domain